VTGNDKEAYATVAGFSSKSDSPRQDVLTLAAILVVFLSPRPIGITDIATPPPSFAPVIIYFEIATPPALAALPVTLCEVSPLQCLHYGLVYWRYKVAHWIPCTAMHLPPSFKVPTLSMFND